MRRPTGQRLCGESVKSSAPGVYLYRVQRGRLEREGEREGEVTVEWISRRAPPGQVPGLVLPVDHRRPARRCGEYVQRPEGARARRGRGEAPDLAGQVRNNVRYVSFLPDLDPTSSISSSLQSRSSVCSSSPNCWWSAVGFLQRYFFLLLF